MVLDRENRELLVAETLDRPVVQVPVGHLEIGGPGDPYPLLIPLYSESVVLGGDQDLPGPEVLHRVVTPPVAIQELGGPAPEGDPQELVAEADPEGRDPRLGQLPDVLLGVGDGGRVPGAI